LHKFGNTPVKSFVTVYVWQASVTAYLCNHAVKAEALSLPHAIVKFKGADIDGGKLSSILKVSTPMLSLPHASRAVKRYLSIVTVLFVSHTTSFEISTCVIDTVLLHASFALAEANHESLAADTLPIHATMLVAVGNTKFGFCVSVILKYAYLLMLLPHESVAVNK